ncbi:fimbrial protein [Burkholderia sp. AU6039]|uniref:fimbrial protein n=1 Tax=Burkholderia sp. AU6039 TaxID=2015344 RepID=UPI000B79E190|nr:fimbrial protein [Burkholderia sp. AU6039]OXJ13287.1 fimbrial protein [Burkholderia sp. AU6039]
MTLIKFSLILLASTLPLSALAKCTAVTTDGRDYYIVKVRGFEPPPFSPGDIPIGGVIYEATATGLTFTNAVYPWSPEYKCPEGMLTYNNGVGTLGPNNVYPTGIPNVGIRIIDYAKRPFPFREGSWVTYDGYWNTSYAPTIQLIKTGNVTEGGVLSGAYARYQNMNASGQILVEYQYSKPVLVTPKVPTCTVTTPRIPVQMGSTLATTTFKGVGTTAPPLNFSIGLSCSGGDTGTSANAYVTLTDTTKPGNRSTTLSLSSDSDAAGVGIQILKDDVVLGYGPDSSALDNPNRWWAGRVRQGEAGMTIPLQARYVQTEQRIKAGIANAYASFTMSYQ